MATNHVKVYEDKKGLPLWAWLIPLLLLLAVLAYFLSPSEAVGRQHCSPSDHSHRAGHRSSRSRGSQVRHGQGDLDLRRPGHSDPCGRLPQAEPGRKDADRRLYGLDG